MMFSHVFYALLTIMVIGSIVAVETKDLLSSVISVALVGFSMGVSFLFLGAPDIAIVQVVMEVLCLIILLRATVRRDDTTIYKYIETFAVATALIFLTVFLMLSYWAFKDLPPFGHPLMTVSKDYLSRGLAETGAANMVTSVLLDFRAYDTLGEATVLFVSVLGAITVLRRRGRKAR